jgi:hypothetical protein
MKKEEVAKLLLGIYRIFWKKKHGGGSSVASVGYTHDGTKWMAPSNWTTESNENPQIASTKQWSKVKRVELITTQHKNK